MAFLSVNNLTGKRVFVGLFVLTVVVMVLEYLYNKDDAAAYFPVLLGFSWTGWRSSNATNRSIYRVSRDSSSYYVKVQASSGDVGNTRINHVLFTVKTAHQFHDTRLKLLLDTWLAMVPNQTYVITDTPDINPDYSQYFPPGHFLPTKCRHKHNRIDLCCKMGFELNIMANHSERYRWFCRADDDTYYNQHALVRTLAEYDWRTPHLLGSPVNHKNALGDDADFMYPVGNGGVCLSRALMDRIRGHIAGNKFEHFCNRRGLTDDVCLGVMAFLHGGVRVEKVKGMYDHGTFRKLVLSRPFNTIVTINYRERNGGIIRSSIYQISPAFNLSLDQSRLYTLHCHFNPTIPYCAPLFPEYHTTAAP